MQYSFYGGQQGKNFEIAAIFKNKIEMMQDLMKRFQSSIAIGDLVLISYGLPNQDSPAYRDNVNLDVGTYGHTYNATLWQKIYTEKGSSQIQDVTGTEIEYISKDFGLGYKLIAVLTGNTPVFDVRYDPLKANQKPSVTIDNTNIDIPILTFHLPVSQILALKNTIVLNANQNPTVAIDNTDINNPKLQFFIPQAQEILPKNVSTTILDVDEDPEVVMENTGSNADGTLKVNKPTLEFKLPQAQEILPEHVTTTPIDADEDPEVIFDNDKTKTNADGSSKVNKPTLEFKLPKSQVLQLKPTIILAPLEDPDIDYDDSGTKINLPELTFSLPRAVRFMYGNRLGTRAAVNYTLNIADAPEISSLRTGDYYVHEGTGFIYLVTGETATSRTFTYQACLAAPEPTVTSAAVDTYEADGTGFKVKEPTINKSWSNTTEQIGRILSFELPKLPNLTGTVTFVGPDESGSVAGAPTGVNTYNYAFTVPSGARFFCGNLVNDDTLTATVPDARPGDFYINGVFEHDDDGHVYKLGTNNVWQYQGTIKGNVGNPLNIVYTKTITSSDVATDDKDLVGAYIESSNGFGRKLTSNEIAAITYRSTDASGTIDTAYWYFVVNGTWDRAQLTGATASLIENNYKQAGDSNKAYSVTYINNLLVALDATLTASEKKIKTYSAEAIEGLISWGNFTDL